MNKPISRRKLLFLAGMATSIVMPATMLIASNAEAQQADQTPSPGQTAPKKKPKKKDGDLKLRRGHSDKTTEGAVVRQGRRVTSLVRGHH